MFVFKAAVIGAGTMGGQIAQTIAAAGIPVVLKDVKDELVQAGLDEARSVSEGQVARLVKKGKLSEEQAAAQVDEIVEATNRPDQVVGFHYFYPAAVMPLVEVIEGDDTSQETVTAALNFAQAIKKQPIACAEVPGFVVNRILNSGIAEIWREQEEKGLSIKAIDEGVGAANVTPMGPYFLISLLSLY